MKNKMNSLPKNIGHTWVEIDSSAIEDNITAIRDLAQQEGKKWMLMVKANAYGHGLLGVAVLAERLGAEFLGVSYIEEAIELRKGSVKAPILLFTEPDRNDLDWCMHEDVTPVVSSRSFLEEIVDWTDSTRTPFRIHLKMNSGLGRLGFDSSDIDSINDVIKRNVRISIEGVLTHYSADNADQSGMHAQLQVFMSAVRKLSESGLSPKYIHVSNSAATGWLKESDTNLVRIGLAAYGLEPSNDKTYPVKLRQGFRWNANIVSVRSCRKGDRAGYNGAWTAQRDSRIGTISVGYADGLRRAPSGSRSVLCRGMRIPIIAQPMMSHSLVDLTDLPDDLLIGEKVVIIGDQGEERITFEEIALTLGTINEEVAVSIPTNILRIFSQESIKHGI